MFTFAHAQVSWTCVFWCVILAATRAGNLAQFEFETTRVSRVNRGVEMVKLSTDKLLQ